MDLSFEIYNRKIQNLTLEVQNMAQNQEQELKVILKKPGPNPKIAQAKDILIHIAHYIDGKRKQNHSTTLVAKADFFHQLLDLLRKPIFENGRNTKQENYQAINTLLADIGSRFPKSTVFLGYLRQLKAIGKTFILKRATAEFLQNYNYDQHEQAFARQTLEHIREYIEKKNTQSLKSKTVVTKNTYFFDIKIHGRILEETFPMQLPFVAPIVSILEFIDKKISELNSAHPDSKNFSRLLCKLRSCKEQPLIKALSDESHEKDCPIYQGL
jgi:hypothetical protein